MDGRLLIVFVIGFLVGTIVVLIGGLSIYTMRYNDAVCLPQHQFQKLFDAANPFVKSQQNINFSNLVPSNIVPI